jgi:hypothetical protein
MMTQHPKIRPVLAAMFLVAALVLVFYQLNELSLTASIFDGAGLIGGLGAAQSELSGTGIRTSSTLGGSIAAMINFLLTFAAIFAFVAFVIAGFIFILGFGSDQANQRAKKIMIWSAVGLLVIIFSFVLTQFIVNLGTA